MTHPRRPDADPAPPRRGFLLTAAVAGGLAASYGTFAAIAGRFLFPARPRPKGWLFVADLARLKPGDAVDWRTPAGAPVTIARHGSAGTADDFIALSSTCPHLGCQVHWEGHRNRFFCPCHNGVFDPSGKAIAGPPAEAGQSLPRYPLKVEKGLLFIEVPLETRTAAAARLRKPGHDGCLTREV